MSVTYTSSAGVVVNKINKADYDTLVASGAITPKMIEDEVWIFADDNFLSAENLAKLNALDLDNLGEVNAIDGVTVNGATISPDGNKIINIVVPTKLSDLQNDLLSAWATGSEKPTYSYDEITGKPELATVATSGSYNDLTDLPTIPTGNATTRIWSASNN